jgi:hypothetical protein
MDMPIHYEIDNEKKLIRARAYGSLTDEDVFGYQRNIMLVPGIQEFDELLDMCDVSHVEVKSADRMDDLAAFAASSDHPRQSARFAIIAGDVLKYGLARMYQTYREMNPRSTKVVGVFHTTQEAMEWLQESADSKTKI